MTCSSRTEAFRSLARTGTDQLPASHPWLLTLPPPLPPNTYSLTSPEAQGLRETQINMSTTLLMLFSMSGILLHLPFISFIICCCLQSPVKKKYCLFHYLLSSFKAQKPATTSVKPSQNPSVKITSLPHNF